MDILSGDIFNYKGVDYVAITTNVKMKNPITGEWQAAIYYYAAANIQAGYFVRERVDFEEKFKKGQASRGG